MPCLHFHALGDQLLHSEESGLNFVLILSHGIQTGLLMIAQKAEVISRVCGTQH